MTDKPLRPTRTPAEEIGLAERLDASGAHDDAVNALARATGLGDAGAATQLAKRLIRGDRAPFLPAEGARLLADAVKGGGAEAAARLSVLAAAGAYVEHSVEHALALLVLAAERGWVPAQQQLRALAEGQSAQAAAARGDGAVDPTGQEWRQLGSSIDLGFFTTAPPPRTLSESPLIRSFEALLPVPLCGWLVERSRDRLQRALVYDPVGGQELADHTRTNTVAQFDLMDTELIHLLVQIRMAAACGIPLQHFEATAVLHYEVGEEITNHYDFVNPSIPNYAQELARNGQRVLTFLIYLNEDYAGGETAFPRIGIEHKGRLGEGLFFVNALANGEPDSRTVHAGRPPTSGEKWIVSQFVRSRRLLGAAGDP